MTDSNQFFCNSIGAHVSKVMCRYWQERAIKQETPKEYERKCIGCEQGRKIVDELR